MKRVLVFITSLEKEEDILKVKPVLDQLIGTDGRWNFDLEDCDRILRVETPLLPESAIAESLHACGYACSELP